MVHSIVVLLCVFQIGPSTSNLTPHIVLTEEEPAPAEDTMCYERTVVVHNRPFTTITINDDIIGGKVFTDQS